MDTGPGCPEFCRTEILHPKHTKWKDHSKEPSTHQGNSRACRRTVTFSDPVVQTPLHQGKSPQSLWRLNHSHQITNPPTPDPPQQRDVSKVKDHATMVLSLRCYKTKSGRVSKDLISTISRALLMCLCCSLLTLRRCQMIEMDI